MNEDTFQGIAAGLEDAIAFVQGDTARGRIVTGPDVQAIRKTTGLTQPQFAATYHLPVGTLRDWEQGRRQPDAPARALLAVIAADPVAVGRMLAGH